nr:tetratricopeptide repeat protein [Alphaproteobacteria bacterium]
MVRTFLLAFMVGLALTSASVSVTWAAGNGGGSSDKKSPFSMGVTAVNAGDYRKAIGLFKQADAKNPDNANTWNYLGFSYRKLGQMDLALAAYKKALAIDP